LQHGAVRILDSILKNIYINDVIGGAMMARRLSTTDRWVTLAQYQEVGPQVARMVFV